MIKKSQKLNRNLFSVDVEQESIRQGFGKGLLQAAKKDERVVGLCADLTESTRMHFFRNAFPHRFVEIGIAEQNLASVASGMAAMGKIPFISSYAMFNPGRNWEQIRTTICYNNVPVKIVGSHAGVSVGKDGGTHQAIEDIAIMRVLPRIVVVVPCDSEEARKATLALAKTDTPVYLRLAREKTPIITTKDTPFKIGQSDVLFEPKKGIKKKIGIIACGSLVYNALVVASELEKENIGVSVLKLSTIKPLDEDGILEFSKKHEGLVTVEEHQVAGGMGGAISEFISQNNPIKMGFIGVQDKFGQSGTQEELIKHYGMDTVSIKKKIKEVIKKK